MKKALLSIMLLIGFCAAAQGLTPQQKTAVTNFVACIKKNDKDKLAALITFPLKRQYPIPSIKNKKEFLKRYNEVFDGTLIEKIKTSDVDKDWSAVGWRGIMLLNGEVWLDEEGKLTAVNYESPAETKMREALIVAEKKTLHASVKEFETPVCLLLTEKFRIRIDLMPNGTYRYASWAVLAKMGDKPDLVINGGTFVPDGSANYHYSFKNGEYEYQCAIMAVGADDSAPAYLAVFKNDKEVLSQEARIVEP